MTILSVLAVSGVMNAETVESVSQYPDYNLIGISYTNILFDIEEDQDISMNGFSANYTHGFNLIKKLPLYFETGVNFSFGIFNKIYKYKDKGEKYKTSEKLSFISVPLNIAYKFDVNDKFSVKPFLGLNAKVNVLGKTTVSYDGEKESMNWYDKDNDGYFKRFQLGWHIGVGAQYSKIYLGLDYGTDFIKLADEIGTGTFNFTVGYSF